MGPYYPQQQQQQQPAPRRRWTSTQIQVASGIAVLVLAASCVAGYAITNAFTSANPPAGTLPTQPATVYVATNSPTRPTATPKGPRLITTAVYGGPQSAFTAAYGDPTTQYGQSFYSATLVGGTAITICFCDSSTGPDGQPHGDILQVYPTDSTQMSDQLASAVTHLFLPSDARFLHDTQTPDVGLEHVYQSADLAKTFPNDDSSGIFSVDCQSPVAQGCSFVTGE